MNVDEWEEPVSGLYKTQLCRGGPWVEVEVKVQANGQVFVRQDGVPMRTENLPVNYFGFLKQNPISPEEYERLKKEREDALHDLNSKSPRLNPRRPIDLSERPLI